HYPNFAIAEMVMVGAYVAIALQVVGVPLPLAVGGAGLLVGALATALDQGLFRRVRRYGPLPPLLMSIGVMFILRSAVRFAAGNRMRAFDLPVLRPLEVLGLRIGPSQLVMIGASVALLAVGHLLLARTRIGKAIRAPADNAEVAP